MITGVAIILMLLFLILGIEAIVWIRFFRFEMDDPSGKYGDRLNILEYIMAATAGLTFITGLLWIIV